MTPQVINPPPSPAELILDVLRNELDPALAPGGVVVGPANDEQQTMGVVSLVDAGMPRTEKYAPLIWDKAQLRCIAQRLTVADTMARGIQMLLNQHGRVIAHQDSTGSRYLIHTINVLAGPSMHYDTPESWETLLFAEVLIGTQPA